MRLFILLQFVQKQVTDFLFLKFVIIIQIQMSNPQNIHRKILTNHPLKTNFISNTNIKNKSENEKRFSNIARQKQTIQKNTTRYYEQIDMQGSATILPNKTSTRQNQYINQNTNINLQLNQNNYHNQIRNNNTNPYHINMKSKSPTDNNKIKLEQIKIDQLSTKAYPSQMKKNNSQVSNNFTAKNSEIQTQRQRQKSLKSFIITNNKDKQKQKQKQKQKEKQKQKDQQKDTKIKNKSNIYTSKIITNQIDDDLLCDQDIDLHIPIERKQSSRTISLVNKSNITSDQLECQYDDENHYKTQKKYLMNHSTIMLEKTKSQHNLLNKDSAVIGKHHHVTANNLYQQQTGHRQTGKHLTTPTVNYEQELKKFHFYQIQMNIVNQIQKIQFLSNRHKSYSVQPNFIELKQKNFNWFMRAVLTDWMMHVCYQFSLKRETYYIAVGLADKYLQQTTDLPKSQFQLIGAACMYIAAKLQEFQALSSADFSKSTDNRYSHVDIKQMQSRICRALNYQLNPPTLYMWANRFMVNWDNYIMLTDAKNHPYFDLHSAKYFKKDSQQSYLLFRQMLQMLDCSILDVQTLQFPPKILVCSFMYLVLGKNYKEWGVKRIVEQFPRSSHYLVSQDDQSCFNNLFHMFLLDSFNINLHELLPAVQYCSTYFTLPLNFDEPSISNKNQSEEQNQMSLQEYQSFQTYHGKMIDLVRKRYRGVYL